MKSALLFYWKLVGDLKRIGFELNPYDPFVANTTSKGKQSTVYWHVNDLKISHKDKDVVFDVIEWFKINLGGPDMMYGFILFRGWEGKTLHGKCPEEEDK